VRSFATRLAILAVLFGPGLDLGVALGVIGAQRGATIDGGAARRSGDRLVERDLTDDGLDDVTIEIAADEDVLEPVEVRTIALDAERPLRTRGVLARAGRTTFGDLFRPPRSVV
jgi:hypothetical protein